MNPNTKEVHPICATCKSKILTYRGEILFLGKVLFLGVPLLILLSMLCFIFSSWQKGVLFVVGAVLAAIVSFCGANYFVTRKEKKLGTYVDRKKIRWCQTCKYFQKTRNWNALADPLWRSKELISPHEIPCKVVEDTKSVWVQYFNEEISQRCLYPKNCDKWVPR